MKIIRVFVAFALVVAGVVSTVGTGGGGGFGIPGGSPVPGVPPSNPPPGVEITIANAQHVSATVVQDAEQVFDYAATIGGQIFPSLPSAPDLLSSNSKFELFATTAATGGPVTDTCAISGTVTVSGQPGNNPVSLSEGDVFDLTFDTCDDGDGYALDGSFSVIVDLLEGDPRTDVFSLRYEVRDDTVTVASDDGTQATSDGSHYSLTWDSLGFPETVLSLRPLPRNGLFLSSQADSFHLLSQTHSLTLNADISVSTTLRDANGFLESAFLGGYISYQTIVLLQAPDGQAPESGEILVSSSSTTATIRIVIESSASVRLEIDLDGDGVIDDIQHTTWATLLG